MADPPETPVAGESPVASTTTVTSSPPTGQVSLPNPTAAPAQTTVTTNMVPTVQTPTPSVGSNTATPASTPTPESTPTTPVANTPTPVQQQQLQHLDQQHIQQQQHMTTVVGQPQLAPQQGQPQMMQQQQQTIVAQHQPQMSQMPMQQQQLQQLQQVQQMSQQQMGQVQQQMGPQQMQMPAQQQLQQPMMSQQQVQMQPQAQQIQPTTALQQQLQQPSLQQLQQQVQVVQQPQTQQNIQQMTQNNQSLSIVQSPTTMTGNIQEVAPFGDFNDSPVQGANVLDTLSLQAGTIRHAPLGSFFLPGIQNTILSNMVFQDMLQKQISAGNISQGITVQQNRPQGLTNNQQKNATQSTVSTVQGNNKQLASNKQGTGQQQQQQQQQAQQQQQQGPLIGNKPITQSQGTQHLVIGSLGTISNQGNMLGANKTGHVSIAGTSATQVLNPQTQIRLGGPNTLVTSTGQILTSPTLQILNQIQPQIPTFAVGGAQVLMGSQASVQPVVLRTAGPIQGRHGVLSNIQAVTPAQLKRKVEGQNLQLVKLANGKGWKPRTIQPGQPGRPIQPKGGLPDPASKPQTMLVTPKSKKQAATTKIPTSSSTTAVTTTTPSEQNNKNVVVTSSSTTTSKPSTPTQKLETSTPPQEDQPSNPKSAPPQASVQPIVTAQPTVNGSAIVESSGTNGTMTEVGVVAKTEPMEVDKGEADIEEDTTVEMTDQTEESNKGKLKAVIKPHILTHIIDNFVIQEGNEPFPVQKSSLMTDFLPAGMNTSDRSDTESTGADAKERTTLPPDSPKIKCEFCGKVDFAAKFRRSKRFCSISCAKRYNVGCSKRLRLINNQNGIDHPPSGSKYVKKRKTPEMKKKWKRQEGRVTTGPIQRTPSQCSETGAWSSTTSEAASEITTEDEARSTTDDTTTPNDSSPPRSPPVLEREGGFIGNSSQQREAMTSHQRQQYRSQQQGNEVSPGSAGLIVIQPNTGLADSQSSSTSTSSMSAVSPRPASSTSPACHRRHPSTWSVLDVYEFIHLLPGCSPYADEFRSQEIDGQALMLLKEDHLMSAMNMKLGPALKICAKITSLKEEHS